MSEEFYKRWFGDFGETKFSTIAEYYQVGGYDLPFTRILSLEEKNLKPFTKELLQLPVDDPIGRQLNEIKRGFIAYLQFQDLLDIKLELDEKTDLDSPIIAANYPYYESLIYLKEILMCLIEKNILAVNTLIRPFLELSITFLYWKLRCGKTGYGAYYEWLKNKRKKPPFRNMLEWFLNNLEARPHIPKAKYNLMRESLIHFYGSISEYHHSPLPQNSMITLGGGNDKSNVYPFFCALSDLELILNNIVYLYILAHPIILYPVELHKKFGFKGPIGLFADNTNFQLVKAYIGTENIDKLREQLKSLASIKGLLGWFENYKDLTEEELEESWSSFKASSKIEANPDEITVKLLLSKSLSRAQGWFFNYLEKPETYDWISDEDHEKFINKMKNWTD